MKKVHIFFILVFLFGSFNLNAEGSVDFIDYPGHRLFLRSDRDQQMKVYAESGEFINVGSSHAGFDGGIISVYRPDGSLHTVFDGSDGSTAIIFNNIQELNGPIGSANNGYNPGVVQVTPGTEGIWSVVYSVPTFTGAAFGNLLNNAPWTRANNQPTNGRVITSWDITVSENAAGDAGGNFLSGRVYTNEYNSMISQNGTTTSPQFFVLTPDGLLYTVDFMETDPWGFPLSSSSLGLLNSDRMPSYQSWPENEVFQSNDPTEWEPGKIYQYEPQAEDDGGLINNKIFFNTPDMSMPNTAPVTDIFRSNPHTTWLYTDPFVFDIMFGDFTINSSDENGDPCNIEGLQYNQGAYFVFDTNLGGNVALELDINDDGDLDDPEDLTIFGYVNEGVDSIYWNGRDGLDNPIPVQDNFTFSYQFYLRGGENHIVLSDVENNEGGVVFELLSDVGAIQTDLFYYDHTPVGGPVSGGGTPGNAEATNIPFTYNNQFGNKKALDYWAYVVYGNMGGGEVSISIVEDCTIYNSPDTDGDGIADDIDLDDDNDGIPDYLEYCTTNDFSCLPNGIDPSGNQDTDPHLNYNDTNDPAFTNPCVDNDGNGICDAISSVYDFDGDGIINSLDLDSDNDGISDLQEANHGQLDLNNDGIIDGAVALFGENGFFNVLASDPDLLDAVALYTPSDKDNDSVIDAHDLDSDNDGIYDVAEAGKGYADEDNDGRINNSPVAVDLMGVAFSLVSILEAPLDKDGDTVADFRDLDSDNDTFLDVGENKKSDPDNDGRIGTGVVVVNIYGVAIDGANIPLATSVLEDQDGDGVANFHDLDSDNDGINDVTEYWASAETDPNNDGIGGYGLTIADGDGVLTVSPDGAQINSGSNPVSTDTDALFDVWDLDSDNDGINDVEEAGHEDPDNDGIIQTGNPTVNEDGQATDGIGGAILPISNAPDHDGDGIMSYVDLDSDNDGINDVVEGGNTDSDNDGIVGIGNPFVNQDGQTIDENDVVLSTSLPAENDGDAIPNYVDLDSDNDGINDVIEGGNTDPDNDGIIGTGSPVVNTNGQAVEANSNPADTDNDEIPDYLDLDSDNDGINDVVEGGNTDPDNDGHILSGIPEVNTNGQAIGATSQPLDTDTDGVPNYLDLDSDNDGINDVEEGGNADPDNDGVINTGTPTVNADGQADGATSQPLDTDSDGVPDYLDLDSDNDGINDVEEGGNTDPDNDGIVGTGTPTVNANGQTTGATSDPIDTDGDGIPNYQDLDSDNDGINDVIEAQNNDPDNDGIVGTGIPIVNSNGQTENTTSNPVDTDGDGVANYLDLDSDNDGINDVEEAGFTDPDNDGIVGTGTPMVNDFGQAPGTTSIPTDTDNDGYPDYLDLDSDNDGINDVVEAGNTDPDNDGIIGTGTPTVNADGQADGVTSNPTDTDGDGIADYQDLDSDNDGINDVVEGGNTDPDNDGMVGTGTPVVNTNGQTTDANSNPTDTDGDGYPDYVDLDSDNDGINDVTENGGTDPDGDGIVGTGTPTVNGNGQAPGTTSNPTDTDGDGVPNYQDLDSDNDGINDVVEGGNEDPDNDGIVGTGTPTVNENGQPDGATSNPIDTDGDGVPNYVDLDSDNDGINDVVEGGNEDPDNDGIVGTGIPPVNENGQTAGTTSNPTDTDEDGMPDYLDLDSDGDNISDVVEGGNEDPDNDGIVGTGTPVVNTNGQPNGSTSMPPDTDMDGAPDYQDLDSDGDGIVDIYECPDDNTCVDSDNDGIPDFQDIDSDNDGINDIDECETGADCVDTDMDGTPDYIDLDTDNDGIPDELECPDGAPCPDEDMDGIPDWRDPLCIIAVTAITGGGNYCEDETVTLTSMTNITGEQVEFVWTNTTTNFVFSGIANGEAPLTLVFLNANPTHSGVYILSITTPSDNCTTSSAPVSVNVTMTPNTPVLTTDSNALCAGGNLVLNTDDLGSDVNYEWFFNGNSLAVTNTPSYTIENTTTSNAGNYTVIASENDCPSEPSNSVEITIENPVTDITAISSTTTDTPACEGGNVTLSVSEYTGATVEWFDFNNTSVGNTFTLVLDNVMADISGEYYAIVTFEVCGEVQSSAVNVQVIDTPDQPVLSAAATTLCAGQDLELTTSTVNGDNITYEWYADYGNGIVSLATTNNAAFSLENMTTEQTGLYYVNITNSGCTSSVSAVVEVTVISLLTDIVVVNNTNAENPACLGEDVTLSIEMYENATVEWFGPNGLFGTGFEVTLANISAADAGEYFAVVTVEICGEVNSETTEIFVQDNSVTPELAADNDEICAGQSVELTVINTTDLGIESGDNVTYTWYNTVGEEIATTATSNFTFEDIQVEGEYSVIVNINGCAGTEGDFFLTVSMTPNEAANIPENTVYFCAEEALELQAVATTESMGTWRSLGTAVVLNPTQNISAVSGLVDGPNVFVWGLSIDACGEFSTDTITVFAPASLQAFDDAYTVEQNERLENLNAAENDIIGNATSISYTIVTDPQNGTATMNEAGVFSYTPDEDFEGADEFIYSLCSDECPDDCVTAVVKITVENTIFVDDCFVPNGITPNGDGANDFLEIPCLNNDQFPDNNIMIFNRWGDKVYAKTGYNNDWGGTYKNQQLPAGTYFYILEITPGSEPIQDFFTIVY